MDVSAFRVERAGSDDIGAVVESVAGLFREDGGTHDPVMNVAWPAAEGTGYYTDLLGDGNCLLLVARKGEAARSGERVVGHLVGRLVGPDALRLARVAVLESLRVRPDVRGRGVGGALIEEFLAWARRREARHASVTAFGANEGARRLYARYGFAPLSVVMRASL